MSTAKIVLFHHGSTEFQRCENCIFVLPVNILTGVARRLLGPHDTLPCVLILMGVVRQLLGPHDMYMCLDIVGEGHLLSLSAHNDLFFGLRFTALLKF